MPHSLIARITYALFSLICALAIWQGDRLKKLSGGVLLITTVATPLIQDRINWMDPQARFLIEDCALLVFFLALAARYGRGWMIFAAAFQLLSTLSHPAAHFAQRISPSAYIAVFQLFSYGVYLSLGVGTLAGLIGRSKSRLSED